MSAQQSQTADSPRRPIPLPSLSTGHQSPSHTLTQQGLTSSPRPLPFEPTSFTPANMSADVLTRPRLPAARDDLPWQARSDNRLPNIRSLINLPPLEPLPLPPHPAMAAASNPPASRSYPPLAPVGPSPSMAPLSFDHHHHNEHTQPRVPLSRPHSLNSGISPAGYVTSPSSFSLYGERSILLSPAVRHASPPQQVHHHSMPRSAVEVERRREGPHYAGPSMVAPVSSTLRPTVVRIERIPERGDCYVYDDGSICEVTVGGEPVNPEWGLTRAGRPRKRLAKACNNCREKKVRCEPGETRCVRCARQGEECKWSDERDANSATDATGIETRSAFDPQPHISMPITPPYTTLIRPGYDPLTETREDYIHPRPAKRRRTNSSPRAQKLDEDVKRHIRGDDGGSARRRSNESTTFDDSFDPFRTDPASASRLMTLYFCSPICSANTILPQEHLLRYAKTGDKVSMMERLFICTTLVLGSLFSHEQHLRVLGHQVAKWAYMLERDACFTVANLSIILARLNLALYYLSIDDKELGRSYLATALADLKKMNLNIEGGAEQLITSSQDTFSSLGLPMDERIEALRRAYWLGYLIERLTINPSDQHLFTLQTEDTYLRLPSSDRNYAHPHTATPGAFFDAGFLTFTTNRPEELGPTSHILLISSILSSVLQQTQRSSHRRSLATYPSDYTAFYAATIRRLGDWEAALPGYLHQTHENTMLHVTRGELATYLTLHTIYHTAAMYLHRYIRHALLPADMVRRNIQQSTAHAVALLDLFNAVVRAQNWPDFSASSAHSSYSLHHQDPHNLAAAAAGPRENPLTLPLLAPAALLAADILSCAGSVEKHLPAVLHLLQSAQVLVTEVARWQASARSAEEGIAKRMGQFRGVRGGTWRMESGLVGNGGEVVGWDREFDVLYGVDEYVLQGTRGEFVVGPAMLGGEK